MRPDSVILSSKRAAENYPPRNLAGVWGQVKNEHRKEK